MEDHHQQTHVTLQLHGQVITWQMKKRYIFTSRRPIATKLDREVAFDKKMLFAEPHNLFITWIYQVTWQIKNVLSPIPRDLWTPNLTRWLLLIRKNSISNRPSAQEALVPILRIKDNYVFKTEKLTKKICLKRFLKQKSSFQKFWPYLIRKWNSKNFLFINSKKSLSQ